MPVGYYNFSPIMQGNEFAAEQLAGLGQQIGNAIQTQAATRSAQTMLPAIQNQYAQGMQKLATGDQSGISDVVQAAGLAGQNPLTQHLSNQFITGMTQVNELARNKALADARVQGAMLAAQSRLQAANISHSDKGVAQTELYKTAMAAPGTWKKAYDDVSSIANEKDLSDPQNLKKFFSAYDTYSQQKRTLPSQYNLSNQDFDSAGQTAYNVWANKHFKNPSDPTLAETFKNVALRVGLPASQDEILNDARQRIANAKDKDAAAKSVANTLTGLGINPKLVASPSVATSTSVAPTAPAQQQAQAPVDFSNIATGSIPAYQVSPSSQAATSVNTVPSLNIAPSQTNIPASAMPVTTYNLTPVETSPNSPAPFLIPYHESANPESFY